MSKPLRFVIARRLSGRKMSAPAVEFVIYIARGCESDALGLTEVDANYIRDSRLVRHLTFDLSVSWRQRRIGPE